MFGDIGNGGSVRNLGIDGVEIIGTGSVSGGTTRSNFGIGSVAGHIDGGSITGCYSAGTVNGRLTFSSNMSSGGNSSNWSTYFGIGGIVGNLTNGTVTNCYSAGAVDGSATYSYATFHTNSTYSQSYTLLFGVGGVAGIVIGTSSSITNSYSAKTVTGNAVNSTPATSGYYKRNSMEYGVGGVAGYGGGTISNCYSIGAVISSADGRIDSDISGGGGGIIGNSSIVSNCAALNPSITGESDFGADYNRVTSYGTTANLVDNLAFREMDAFGGITFKQDERYGTDITTAEIISDAAMNGRFTAENGWTIVDGKLPGLFGKAVEMPEHLLTWLDITRHVVSFNLNGGTGGKIPGSFRIIEGDTVSKTLIPSTIPFTKIDSANDGKWYIRTGTTEEDYVYTEFIFGGGGTPITENTTLYLQWFPPYTVSFNLNGGSGTAPADVRVIQNGTLNEAHRPSTAEFTTATMANDGNWYIRTGTIDEGYVYTEFIFGSGGTPITENTTLYLRYFPSYTISFNLSGGSGKVPANILVIQDGTANETQKPSTASFTKTNYINDGKWYTRTGTTEENYVYTEFIFGSGGTSVTENTTLYLQWTIDTSWFDPQIAGAGTAAEPYLIVNPKQLAYIALMVNNGDNVYANGYYRLENDIDLSAYSRNAAFNGGNGWIPIGTYAANFSGEFDGGGNVISGLYINNNALNYAGLFGYITYEATIQKIGLEDVNITAQNYVGGIVGYISSNLTNCYVTGIVKGSDYVGGIVGTVGYKGKINNCYTTADVISPLTGTVRTGGIAGNASIGTTSNNGGYIANSASLSLSVKGCTSSIDGCTSGRIVGDIASSATLANNVALDEMLNGDGAKVWKNKGLDNLDGEDITKADIDSGDGTIDGRFTAEDGWIVVSGELPVFRKSDPSSSSSEPSSSSSNEETKVRLPQIATGNSILQVRGGINLQVTKNAVVEIYSLNGKNVARYVFNNGVYTVSLKHLPEGLYIVKATFGSEKKMLKVIKFSKFMPI